VRSLQSKTLASSCCVAHYNFFDQQTRCFFFGSGSDDSGDGDDKKDGDNNKKKDFDAKGGGKDDNNRGDEGEPADTSEQTASSSNPSEYRKSRLGSAHSLSGSNIVLPASRPIGFGDQAPRYPHLMAIPVLSRPVFPGVLTPLTITDKDTIKALEKILAGGAGGYLGLFLKKDHQNDVPEIITAATDLYKVGTFAQIQRLTKFDSNDRDDDDSTHPFTSDSSYEDHGNSNATPKMHASLLLMPHRRINLLSVDDVGPPIDVTVSHWDRLKYVRGEDSSRDDTIRALSQEVLGTIREVAQMNALFKEQVVNLVPSSHMFDMNDPFKLADFAAALSIGGNEADLQAVLEEKDPELRLHKSLVLLSKEREVSKLQREISAKVEEKMSEAQRKYFLTEQLKSIKKELGMEKDDKETLIEKYRKKLAEYPVIPEEINETIESELEKFSHLEKNSAEFNITRTYLDWLTNIPWGVVTTENFNITSARRVLDRDHYGMDEVKETILQFIAVGKLKGKVQGKILCLAGPPGVGKTSLVRCV
jgi:Lon-like ATP-dependent protease